MYDAHAIVAPDGAATSSLGNGALSTSSTVKARCAQSDEGSASAASRARNNEAARGLWSLANCGTMAPDYRPGRDRQNRSCYNPMSASAGVASPGGQVAQLVEHQTENLGVPSSILGLATTQSQFRFQSQSESGIPNPDPNPNSESQS